MDKKVLYHYCSPDVFCKIIKNHSIWLSDISKSNDSMELKWLYDRCADYLFEAWKDYVIDSTKYRNTIDIDSFKAIYDPVRDASRDEPIRCWAFCLSQKGDDLGQWRGYADNGEGLSIGFNSEYFEKFNKHSKRKFGDGGFMFARVSYSEEAVKKMLYDIGGLSQVNGEMESSEAQIMLGRSLVSAYVLSPFYKNPKFEEEKEWRLACTMALSDLQKGKTPVSEFQCLCPKTEMGYDYITSRKELVSHVEIKDDEILKSICEVWIGPKCPMSVFDVYLFLVNSGVVVPNDMDSVKIYKSKASYK